MRSSLQMWRGTIIAAFIAGLPGVWIAHNLHAGAIADAKSAIATNQAQLDSVTTLVARIPSLRAEYARLARLYIPPNTATAYWQSTFVRALQRESTLHRLRIDEISWSTQPQPPPIPQQVVGSSANSNPQTLFNELSSNITIHGTWRNLLPLLSDLPKNHFLLAVSGPNIGVDNPNLALRFRADLLIPHVVSIGTTKAGAAQ